MLIGKACDARKLSCSEDSEHDLNNYFYKSRHFFKPNKRFRPFVLTIQASPHNHSIHLRGVYCLVPQIEKVADFMPRYGLTIGPNTPDFPTRLREMAASEMVAW